MKAKGVATKTRARGAQAVRRTEATETDPQATSPLVDPLERRQRSAARCIAYKPSSEPGLTEVYAVRKVSTVDFALGGFAEIVGLDVSESLIASAESARDALGPDATPEQASAAIEALRKEAAQEILALFGRTLRDPDRRSAALARCDAYLCVAVTHLGVTRRDLPAGALPVNFDPTKELEVFAPLTFVPASEPSDTAARKLSVSTLDEEERIFLGLLIQQAFNPAERVGLLHAITSGAD